MFIVSIQLVAVWTRAFSDIAAAKRIRKLISFLGIVATMGSSGFGCSSEPPIERPEVRSAPGWTIQPTDARYTVNREAWTPEPIHVSGECPAGTKKVFVKLYEFRRTHNGDRWQSTASGEANVVGRTWKVTIYPVPSSTPGFVILRATPRLQQVFLPLGYEKEGAETVLEIVEKGS